MSTRTTVLVLVLMALIYSPMRTQAAQGDLAQSDVTGGDPPFTATFSPPSSGLLSLPFAFGVRFTAWWNDLTDASALEFRSDGATAPRFHPPVRQQFPADSADLRSSRFAVNLLARRPFGFSDTFPEGRWSPYLGVGTGGQLSPLKVSLLNDTDTIYSPTVQVVTGVQFFLTRSFSLFGEYRFSPLDHPFILQTEREMLAPVNRLIGGFALHF